MTDNSDLIRLGVALWGDRWQVPMAKALGVRRDTVQDWAQGRMKAPPGVLTELRNLQEFQRAVAKISLFYGF